MPKFAPKYGIGTVVCHAKIQWDMEYVECPDCLGTKLWMITTPVGEEFSVPCLRCSTHGADYSLAIYKYRASVTEYTVGSVRYDSHASRGNGFTYMCKETGIGSGSIYEEVDLYDSVKEALDAASIMATKANANQKPEQAEYSAKRLARTKLTIYQLNNKDK